MINRQTYAISELYFISESIFLLYIDFELQEAPFYFMSKTSTNLKLSFEQAILKIPKAIFKFAQSKGGVNKIYGGFTLRVRLKKVRF